MIRKNRKHQGLASAVRNAIRLMPEDFILKRFLVVHLKAVDEIVDFCGYPAELVKRVEEEMSTLLR